jgi:predicted amidohydrolase YtcJ
MRQLSILPFLLALLFSDFSSAENYKFINGHWFDGNKFQGRVFYSVAGTFAANPPQKIDKEINLQNGYVIPPFGDAHNHYISGPFKIDEILYQYLTDGIFYAKNPASIARDTEKIKDKINKPDSVDVVFAGGAITASGGHPVKLYEEFLNKVKKPGPDGTFENLAYYIIDNEKDLETKWPMIMANKPDFIKSHLLYTEEFEQRRDDPKYYGLKGQDPKMLAKVVEKAHQNNLRVSCHIETAQDFRNALAAQVDEINHMPGYYPDENPDWYPITEADAKRAAAQGVFVVTTTYVPVHEMKEPEKIKRAQEIQRRNLRLLHDAGVKIAIGPDVHGVTSLAEAMNLYALKVFDNVTLLKMWCETTAETIFPKRKIGKLADGYEASFIVLGRDPIANFEEVKNIKLRFKQGNFILQQ